MCVNVCIRISVCVRVFIAPRCPLLFFKIQKENTSCFSHQLTRLSNLSLLLYLVFSRCLCVCVCERETKKERIINELLLLRVTRSLFQNQIVRHKKTKCPWVCAILRYIDRSVFKIKTSYRKIINRYIEYQYQTIFQFGRIRFLRLFDWIWYQISNDISVWTSVDFQQFFDLNAFRFSPIYRYEMFKFRFVGYIDIRYPNSEIAQSRVLASNSEDPGLESWLTFFLLPYSH